MKFSVALVSALIIILFPSTALAQTRVEDYEPYHLDRVMTSLMRENPLTEVWLNFDSWLCSGRMVLEYDPNPTPLQMAAGYILIKGNPVPALFVNRYFLFKRHMHLNNEMDWKFKILVLNHMYSLIKDHMHNERLLRPRQLISGETAKDRARYTWDSELAAIRLDWALLKKMNAEFLMPTIAEAIALHGEERGYIEGLYNTISTPEYQKVVSPEISAALRDIYGLEKDKMNSIVKK